MRFSSFLFVLITCGWPMTGWCDGDPIEIADSAPFANFAEPIAADWRGRTLYLEISKSEQALRVKSGDETFREFHIAWGRGGPGHKERLGDRRTPVGMYRITDFNDNSQFHLFMRLNYPNVSDAFDGLARDVISEYEFNRILASLKAGRLPPQNTALGGAIGIHGVGSENPEKLRIHANMNWTQGCIALTNEEIRELRRYVRVGTEVVIRE